MPKIRAIGIPGRREGEIFDASDSDAHVYTSNGQAERVDEGKGVEQVPLKRRAPVNRMLDTRDAGVDHEPEGSSDPSD